MAKTYKGWTRVNREDAIKDGNYFAYWFKEGFPKITDFCDGTSKGWCDPNDRYEVDLKAGQSYERSIYRSFNRLSDAILYAETGKYKWEV